MKNQLGLMIIPLQPYIFNTNEEKSLSIRPVGFMIVIERFLDKFHFLLHGCQVYMYKKKYYLEKNNLFFVSF